MNDATSNNQPHRLTSLQKAALVLIAMGEDSATEVMKYFTDTEIETITVAIAQNKNIDADDIGTSIEEFYQMIEGKKHILSGGIGYAKKILEDAWGIKKAEEIIQRVEATTEVSAFYLLQTVDDKQLLNFLSNEHPQTVALILANLKSVQAAAILSELPEEMQGEISYRLATMEKTSPELIREIENALREQLGSVFGGQMSKIGGTEAIAEILNSTSRTAEKNILESIESRNPQLFEEIKNLMFTFEDVEKLSDATIQRITREIDSKNLALSMKAASPTLKDKIMRNMSERAAEMLKDELQYLGPVRVKEVETAQSVILDAIRDLDEAGEINMTAGEEGDDRMTNIRIPLKTKVKAIQNKTQKKEDIEIPNNIGLKVQLNKTSKDKFIDENLELKNRILFLEESIQNAREETFLSGIEEGKEQLRHEMESVLAEELEALKKATKTILSEFEKEIKNLNQPILTLSKEIARRIIDSELQFEEKYNEVLLSQIERILHEMIDEEIITIYVAPQQIEWIKKSDIEKHLNVPDKIKLKFFTDKSLVPGECVLESSNLLIEGKFETQLEQIENQLTNL